MSKTVSAAGTILVLIAITFSCSYFSLGEESDSQALDSDGDVYTNEEELNNYNFDPENNPLKLNPFIAELPKIEIRQTTLPTIALEMV